MTDSGPAKVRVHPRGRHRSAKLTREGKAFVFVTVGVTFAALNTGNNLIYLMLGLLLSLILLSMVMSELIMNRLAVKRLPPARAFAETPASVRYVVTNDRRFTPSYSIEIEDRLDGQPFGHGCYFLKLGPGETAEATYARTPQKRGMQTIKGYRIRTRYPFGIVEKFKSYDQPEEWLIYPKLVPVTHDWPDLLRAGEERSIERPGIGSELGTLREYRPGDEARAIHWRRSAALGDIVVREREREAASLVQIFVDDVVPDPKDEARMEAFEASISRAASFVDEAARRGAAIQVVTRSGRSPLLEPGMPPDPVWRYLAALEPVAHVDDDAPSFRRGAHVIDANHAVDQAA